MLADFTITVHEARKPLAVQVKVYENVHTLRRAATRYTNQLYANKKNRPDFSDTLGLCHRFHRSNTPLCAIVRVAPPDIGVGVISHELAHAAVWLWEIENEFKEVPLHAGNDEWFCWVLGELVRQTTLKLYQHKVWID